MVGQLAAIKLRSLWNTMRAQTAILVMSIIGYVYGLVLVVILSVGVLAATITKVPQAPQILVGLGAVYTLGWILLPVVFASQEGTLDPKKLAPFLAPSRKLAWSLLLVTALGVAGIYLVIFLGVQIAAWLIYGGPLVGLIGIVGSLLGVFISLVWSRAAVGWISRFQTGRRSKEKAGLIAFVLLMVILAPMGVWMNLAIDSLGLRALEVAVSVAQWTPVGAPWALAAAAAEGAWGKVAILAAITLVTALVGWWAWRTILPVVMYGQPQRLKAADLEAIEAGAQTLVNPNRAKRQPDPVVSGVPMPLLDGAQRWLRLGVSRPAAAIAERTRMYWVRDPRLSAQLIAAAVLVFVASAMPKVFAMQGEEVPDGFSNGFGVGMLVFSGFILGQAIGILLQYDSTAFWLEVAGGTRGRDDRWGRLLGSSAVVLGFIALAVLIYGLVSGLTLWEMFLVFTLMMLLFSCSQAATSIIGSQWVYPVQPPGTNPLSSKGTGEFWVTMIVGLAQMAFAVLLGLVPLAALGVAFFGTGATSTWTYGAVLLAWLWVALSIWFGVWLGGRILDRTQVEILTKISNWPGHRSKA